jgi:hypothetical protein
MEATISASWLPQQMQEELKDPTKAAQYREGQAFLRGVLARSTTDESFRRQLLTNPKDAIASYYREVHGETPDGGPVQLDVRFVENQGDVTIVLPPAVDSDRELSDAELQAVAGGEGVTAGIVAAATISNMWCLGFAAGAAAVILIAFAVAD